MKYPIVWEFPTQENKALDATMATRMREKAIGWIGKTRKLHVHHAFFFFSYISLPSLHDFERFMGDVNKWRRNFFLSLNFNVVVRNSAPKEFACIWQRTRVEIILIETERTQIHFLREVFVAVAYNHNFNKFSNLTGYEQPWVDHHARALESLNV